jgi:putative transposase
MNRRKSYPSDLSELEWALIAPLLERPKRGGRGKPRTVERREAVNAIL